ncbi:hypothetical protein EJ02DRAFT_506959 [Clathrospora elynae]|uniref:Retrovirus-related Pol polyprotein from transposon TNT 1-94-like beta-barrel domain-containing protein n=1 Tax=Clathrospora elynae TaxID=706981 RepID=A0A6A5S7Z3_9PLEO|nr:hypothetical protein EJ02DRAFT_506959 [Clathrospora elynae]
MQNNCNITVKAMIAEINNKARRDDPVKTAAFASKQGNNSGNNSQQTGGWKDNKNSRRSGRNKDKGAAQTPAQNDSKPKLSQAAQAGSHTANVALRGQQEAPSIDFDANTTDAGISFAFCATAKIPDHIAKVSERAMRLADCADYRNRTIIDTGATDHICNDYAKFIEFDPKPTCAYICTGAGSVKVNAPGTIKMGILCADGKINNVTFSNVLSYASPQLCANLGPQC